MLLSEDHILLGHQDALAYGVNWKGEKGRSDVLETAGSYPAVYGWDIGHLGDETNLDGVPFDDMVKWIKQAYKRGGVITISWHMRNPATGKNAWDKTPAVKSILPGGKNHEVYKGKLDEFASFIKKLKAGFWTRIPIIFRPFHENLLTKWWWWAICTDEEYIELWRFTVDYLRNNHKLNNLLYAYCPSVFDSRSHYMSRYPGDDYVDVFTYTDYLSVSSPKNRQLMLTRMRTVAQLAEEKSKLSSLSETGVESLKIDRWWTEYLLTPIKSDDLAKKLSHIVFWRNANEKHHYVPYVGHPQTENFVEFTNDPLILLEDDLPKLYKKNGVR